MNPATEALLAQPLLASEVIGVVFGLLGLVYGLLWWRERDPGIGWFAASWLSIGLWFGATPHQPLAGPFIMWSPWWYLALLSFFTFAMGLVDHLQVPAAWRRRVLLWTCAPLVAYLALYHLPLLGFELRRSVANLWVAVWYAELGALAWWAGGRERGAAHRLVAVALWLIPVLTVGLALAGLDAPVLRYYAAVPVVLLALTLLTATLLRRRLSLEAEVAGRTEAEAELQRASAVLAHNAELLNLTSEMARVGGWSVDMQTMKLSWTRETFRIAEIDPPHEPPLESGINLFAPEARPVIAAAVQAAIDTGTPYDLELPLITAKGRHLWVRTQGFADRLNGRAVRIYGTFQDVTDRRQAENERKAREQQLQLALRGGNLGLWDWDLASGRLSVNEFWLTMLGLDPDGPPPTADTWHSLVHPDDYATLDRIVEQVVMNPAGRDFEAEVRARHRDGHFVWILDKGAVVERAADGRPLRVAGTHLDITDRRQAEAQRQRAQRELQIESDRAQQYLRVAQSILVALDEDARITMLNRKGHEVLGYAEGELIGRDWFRICVPPEEYDSVMSVYRQLMADTLAPFEYFENHVVTRNGERRMIAWRNSLVLDADGRIRGTLSSGEDITERQRAQKALLQLNVSLELRVTERTHELEAALSGLRQAQDELVRSEKMASLGALVAGVAHELNTPVGNAVLAASTLEGRQREFEAAMVGGLRRSELNAFLATLRETGAVLERNLQRAATLIGSFKQIAVDQSSYQRRAFELSEVVQEIALAISPTLKRSGVQLIEQVPLGLRMDSYPGPLGQVLINLVNNAVVHAFEEGGAVGCVRITAELAEGGHVRLCVSDNGRGIARQHLKRIFDPFFTTRLGQGGSGLGLHIVYTLVTGLLGGRIEVRSEPGQGTEFTIELPLKAPHGDGQSDRLPPGSVEEKNVSYTG